MRGKEPATFFMCSTYTGHAGALLSRGTYALAQCDSNDACRGVTSLAPRLDYRSVDGAFIRLTDPYSLVADGEVDYPFGDGHGKRNTYKMGRVVIDEQAY